MKIFIACSKYFYDKIIPIKEFLESLGHDVILPNSFEEPFAEERMKQVSDEEHVKWKCDMMKRHEVTLRGLDAILVLNFEKKGIPNYIGGATFMEIIKAWEYDCKIFFYNPLPACSFTDELKGMSPIVISGNLEMVQ
jgi:hypothetical protein